MIASTVNAVPAGHQASGESVQSARGPIVPVATANAVSDASKVTVLCCTLKSAFGLSNPTRQKSPSKCA